MAAKIIFILCTQVFLIQSAFSWCHGRGRRVGYSGYGGLNRGFEYGGLGYGCADPALGITATSGGVFPSSSASAYPPIGISIYSQNVYKGILTATGELPFVGTVGVEGVLPTAGAGAVNYGCGNGVTAMAADVTPGIDARGHGAGGIL